MLSLLGFSNLDCYTEVIISSRPNVVLWIPFTLVAAFLQSWRNAFQKQLSGNVNAAGVTLARFIFAWPLAGAYLLVLYYWQPVSQPEYSLTFVCFILITAVCQIFATAFMVLLFQQKNYAIGVGLAKSEAVLAAILGACFFSSVLSPLGWLGVVLGGYAVFLLSGSQLRQLSWPTVLLGLSSGLAFALSSLFAREASLVLGLPFPHGAAWVVFLVIILQTLILLIWLGISSPQTLLQLCQHCRLTLLVSVSSCLGTICWFTAMSLESVALVKTLGQIEVVFTLLISVFFFKEPLKQRDKVGLMLIVLAAVCVMWA